MAPKRGFGDSEHVEKSDSFGGGAMMKVGGQRCDVFRTAIARTIRDQDPEVAAQRIYLLAEWIDLISPAPVQEDQRKPRSVLAIENAGGTRASGQWGFWEVDERHV